MGLEPRGRALHVQAFPGIYDLTDVHHRALGRDGKSEGLISIFVDCAGKTARDRAMRIRPQHLRVMPDLGQLVGNHTISREDLRSFVRYTDFPREAGEDVRFAWLSDVRDGLAKAYQDNPFWEHYLSGIEEGVPRASFWAVTDYGECVPKAVRFMSYTANLGHDYLWDVVVDRPDPRLSFGQYVLAWQAVYDDRNLVVCAEAAEERIEQAVG